MFLSVFEMFKVGIGPSSSHTMGPMVAAARFLDKMRAAPFEAHGLRASLHGSLAFTGVGHATDRATILGLAGFRPDDYDHDKAEAVLEQIRETHTLRPPGLPELAFHPKDDLIFDFGPNLPGHANGMILMATDAQGDVILQETYYSIGGGFVMTEGELAQGRNTDEGDPVSGSIERNDISMTVIRLNSSDEIQLDGTAAATTMSGTYRGAVNGAEVEGTWSALKK